MARIIGTSPPQVDLTVVVHPGELGPVNKAGFVAIGGGAIHAMVKLTIAGQKPSCLIEKTALAVYEAKRVAELAPGVGKLTDMSILNESGLHPFTDEIMKELEKLSAKPTPERDTERVSQLLKGLPSPPL